MISSICCIGRPVSIVSCLEASGLSRGLTAGVASKVGGDGLASVPDVAAAAAPAGSRADA
jgi:hypothetical protein